MLSRIAYGVRAGRAIAAQPYEGVERVLERIAERRDQRGPRWPYEPVDNCVERAHRLIAAPWPCNELSAFEEVWTAALDDLAARGLNVGRGVFGGWDDADERLAELVWCLARHLRPERVVETGVARGLTTRVLLEALVRNGGGHLWSIDLPPLLEHRLSGQTGAAVPEPLRGRWTLVRGSSRRRLPGVVHALGRVDLFVHDSMHTARNVRFELEQVWPALAPGGAVVIDDVEKNDAAGRFMQAHRETPALICTSHDSRVLIGCFSKPGAGSTSPGTVGP